MCACPSDTPSVLPTHRPSARPVCLSAKQRVEVQVELVCVCVKLFAEQKRQTVIYIENVHQFSCVNVWFTFYVVCVCSLCGSLCLQSVTTTCNVRCSSVTGVLCRSRVTWFTFDVAHVVSLLVAGRHRVVRHDRVLRVVHASQPLLQQAHRRPGLAGVRAHAEKGNAFSQSEHQTSHVHSHCRSSPVRFRGGGGSCCYTPTASCFYAQTAGVLVPCRKLRTHLETKSNMWLFTCLYVYLTI